MLMGNVTDMAGRPVNVEPMTNEGWYVVRSLGRTDTQAIEWLKRLDIETYYPMIMQMRKVPRNELSKAQRQANITITRPRLSPLFPRYIFARFGESKIGWRAAMQIAGVGGMVCEGDLPVIMRPELIQRIRQRENNGAVLGGDSVRYLFGIGEEVTVTEGPFASFPGIVERGLDCAVEDLDPEDRIRVAVSIFGRATPVELAIWQVAKRN